MPGDIMVAAVTGGSYQISRVNGNGRSEQVLGYQRNEASAISTASRATSGGQRVFLRPDIGSDTYRLVEGA
jgi:hypothetical protein